MTSLRNNPTAAWAGPLIVFLSLLLIGNAVGTDVAGAPWWRAHPEHWLYPLQTVVCLALIAWWWPHYKFRPLGAGTVALSVAAGALGIALWILPSWLHDHANAASWPKPFEWWNWEWLGVTSRAGDGFDPTIWQDSPALYAAVIGMRFLRMVVAVAFLEELFWRGFLWRTVSHPWIEFRKAPFGAWHPGAFAATVGLFTLAHQPVDYAGAVCFGALTGLLYVRTKSVGACVICHATANLLLGIYVMQTRQWGFW